MPHTELRGIHDPVATLAVLTLKAQSDCDTQ